MSWAEVKIGDFVDEGIADIQTGPFGTQLKARDYVESGTPVINVRNVGYGDLRPEKLEYLPDEKVDQLRVHVLEDQDIVFGRKGAVDRHLFVKSDHIGWVQGSDCIRLRLSGEKVLPKFISYAFRLKRHQEWMLAQCGNKATMASLNQDVIKRIPLRLASRQLQEDVVRLLSSYDDLIENNRRRIALLEEAARLFYREWFVHFRFPGHEHVKITAGVPEGWKRAGLFDEADALYGFAFKSKQFNEDGEGTPVVRIRDILEGLSQTYTMEEAPKDKLLEDGDFLIGMDGIFHQNYWVGGRAWINQRVVRISSKGALSNGYLRQAVRKPVEDFNETIAGTTVAHLGAKHLKMINILVPPKHILEDVNEFLENTRNQIVKLSKQNQELVKGRELLLPRLMDGRLEI